MHATGCIAHVHAPDANDSVITPRALAIVQLLLVVQAPYGRANAAYLLGLLAMIKCSICSYQSDI